eukprot:CAMPEP_0183471478 /NCGR_PEP_ID=MMETSP0370-20130417/157962_1 /TAXON_ID=268820 /ORGANISM="Peridinium aciculiferum, Strain PAER-2" /LENGTH=256 /DNA_ID=CAMNT_0025664061 /DNA_START=21 /DNA_END=791 /DNA_ORIENTATION=+
MSGRNPGVFQPAALAARSAVDVEDDAEDDASKQEASKASAEQQASAEARLSSALEVNRMLHSLLAEKRRQLEASHQGVTLLQSRLDGRAIEEPIRKARLDDLQARLMQAEQPVSKKAAREANLLRREKSQLETRILFLNEENLDLAEKHRKDREMVQEKQHKLRIQGKRERELTKHLDVISRELSEASEAAAQEGNGLAVDYRLLPGLCISKLVGRLPQREPPTLRVGEQGGNVYPPSSHAPSTASSPTRADAVSR